MITVDSLLAGQMNVFGDALYHLILPAFVLAFGVIAVFLRIMRAALLEALRQDYLRTARAKGLREWLVINRHALPNALIPVITLTGLQIGLLMSGSFLVENIFQWPGLGRYAALAIVNADYNATMGITLILTAVYTFINMGVDITYGFVDPRIRHH
jgi:peptide/nickel transport system permease protein